MGLCIFDKFTPMLEMQWLHPTKPSQMPLIAHYVMGYIFSFDIFIQIKHNILFCPISWEATLERDCPL